MYMLLFSSDNAIELGGVLGLFGFFFSNYINSVRMSQDQK